MTGLDPVADPGLGSRLTDPIDHIADPVTPTVSAWNIANALTMLRLALVPVFALALFGAGGYSRGWHVVACAIFVVASLTDRIDGDIARKRGLITDFGKLADPIADKALIGTALVGLSVLNQVSWWATALILVREVGVTLLRFWVIRHGVMPASRGGKLKTLVQAIAIGLLVLPLSGGWHAAASTVMWVAVLLTLVTGVDYVFRAVSLRHRTVG
ncbi:MAG: CDP-diacylglycerol--glycerol-3-phosphate 3-phosphatidyltransferase [Jatrophihabitantaceae bacterium]